MKPKNNKNYKVNVKFPTIPKTHSLNIDKKTNPGSYKFASGKSLDLEVIK